MNRHDPHRRQWALRSGSPGAGENSTAISLDPGCLHADPPSTEGVHMKTSDLLLDAFDRVTQTARRAVDGLDEEALALRVDPGANTIAWLVWHLCRVQDDHLADAFGTAQVWTAQGWADRFGLPFAENATGYGQSADEVAQVRVSAELLLGYLDAVRDASAAQLAGVTDAELDRVVDTAWHPPVTLGVRLVSVVSDGLQHAGQAAYIRGISKRR